MIEEANLEKAATASRNLKWAREAYENFAANSETMEVKVVRPNGTHIVTIRHDDFGDDSVLYFAIKQILERRTIDATKILESYNVKVNKAEG